MGLPSLYKNSVFRPNHLTKLQDFSLTDFNYGNGFTNLTGFVYFNQNDL